MGQYILIMGIATGTITAAAQTVTLTLVSDTVFYVILDGTYTDVEVVFEASIDSGTTYVPYGLVQLENGIPTTATGLLTNSDLGYQSQTGIRNLDRFRVRSLAHTSGTMNVTIISQKFLTEESPLDDLVFGQTNVTTAGVRVILLSGSQQTNTLTIKSDETNTGNIYLGDVTVTSSNGFIIPPGGSLSIDHNHADDNFYIDSDNNGEGVSYIGSIVTT